MKLFVIDTETGGIDDLAHSILSIGGVVWDNGRIGDTIEIFVREEPYLVQAGAMAVNRIDLVEHDAKACSPKDAVERLNAFLSLHFRDPEAQEKVVLVAHNTPFDVGFVKRLFRLAGVDFWSVFSHRSVDTATLLRFMVMLENLPPECAGLSGALKHFGITVPEKDRHTALGDALGTAKVLTHIKDLYSEHFP